MSSIHVALSLTNHCFLRHCSGRLSRRSIGGRNLRKMMSENTTFRLSAVTCDQTRPFMPTTALRMYNIGMLKPSQRTTPSSREMRHFFSVYKTLEVKETVVDEVQGREKAVEIIAHCIDNYINCFCK